MSHSIASKGHNLMTADMKKIISGRMGNNCIFIVYIVYNFSQLYS